MLYIRLASTTPEKETLILILIWLRIDTRKLEKKPRGSLLAFVPSGLMHRTLPPSLDIGVEAQH